MKKLILDVEALQVESFEAGADQSNLGTVRAASDGTYPSDACPATMMLSGCLSNCMASGIRPCLSPPPC